MGRTVYATICYGVAFPEGYEFPWVSDGREQDYETWWAREKGLREGPKGYDWAEMVKVLEDHPIPFDIISSGSDEYSPKILAVPDSVIKSYWGGTTVVPGLPDLDYIQDLAFKDFIGKYIYPTADLDLTPKWYLSVYSD